MSKEIWKDIEEYEGLYQISSLGRIKSVRRYINTRWYGGEIKKSRINRYHMIILYKEGKSKTFYIHRLVAQTFIEKSNLQVNHKDGNKLNNSVDNLEWVTPLENIKHSWEYGLAKKKFGSNNNNFKITNKIIKEINKLKGIYTQPKLAEMFNISLSQVGAIHQGRLQINKNREI
jgi:hypothetical protein